MVTYGIEKRRMGGMTIVLIIDALLYMMCFDLPDPRKTD